jgi:hypothetical protein
MPRYLIERRQPWAAVAAAIAVAALAIPLGFVCPAWAGKEHSNGTAVPHAAWSRAVTHICTHPLLFDGSHEIGTRAGALAVSRDIRSSIERRLTQIERLPARATRQVLARRWLALERRLAATYASSYLQIFEVIAAADTAVKRARAPRLLARLLHVPDRLNQTAARLEFQLHIPDCTGGTPRRQPPRIAA